MNRLKKNPPNQVCTNDVGLNVLESKEIISRITDGKSVLEIGYGNGLLYKELRKIFNLSKYVGTDFVNEFITECNKQKTDRRDEFHQLDMTVVNTDTFERKFDIIISKRAVQNVIDQ